jgi:hypothetical protein
VHLWKCSLTSCGALDSRWSGWRDAEIAGELRVLMAVLVRREPVIWPDAKCEWAGAIPWFDRMGLGLDFGEEG